MVSGLETKLEGRDSNPGRVISLYFWTRCLILTFPFSAQEYQSEAGNCYEFVDLAAFHSED